MVQGYYVVVVVDMDIVDEDLWYVGVVGQCYYFFVFGWVQVDVDFGLLLVFVFQEVFGGYVVWVDGGGIDGDGGGIVGGLGCYGKFYDGLMVYIWYWCVGIFMLWL